MFLIRRSYVVLPDPIFSVHKYVVPALLQLLDLNGSQISVDVDDIYVGLRLQISSYLIQLTFGEESSRAGLPAANETGLGQIIAPFGVCPFIISGDSFLVKVDDQALLEVNALKTISVDVVSTLDSFLLKVTSVFIDVQSSYPASYLFFELSMFLLRITLVLLLKLDWPSNRVPIQSFDETDGFFSEIRLNNNAVIRPADRVDHHTANFSVVEGCLVLEGHAPSL